MRFLSVVKYVYCILQLTLYVCMYVCIVCKYHNSVLYVVPVIKLYACWN